MGNAEIKEIVNRFAREMETLLERWRREDEKTDQEAKQTFKFRIRQAKEADR